MKIDVQIQGAEKAIGKLRAHQLIAKENVKQVIAETASNIHNGATSRAPVDTGYLKNSMNMEILANGLSAEVSNSADYSVHVEYGTKFQRAQPFLFPSFEEERPHYLAKLKKELKNT